MRKFIIILLISILSVTSYTQVTDIGWKNPILHENRKPVYVNGQTYNNTQNFHNDSHSSISFSNGSFHTTSSYLGETKSSCGSFCGSINQRIPSKSKISNCNKTVSSGGVYMMYNTYQSTSYPQVSKIGLGDYDNTIDEIIGGVYNGDEPGIISSIENAILGGPILFGSTTDNHCECGAVNNGNPNVPPCSCHHWKWNTGNGKWVHLGNGQGCDCIGNEPEDTPIGDISFITILQMIFFYYVVKFCRTKIKNAK